MQGASLTLAVRQLPDRSPYNPKLREVRTAPNP